jgi:hypothetical protein
MITEKKGQGLIPFPIALFFALILDALDFFIVGLIPVLGAGIDIVGSIIVWLSVGARYVIITSGEYLDLATLGIPILLPFELFPANTAAIIVGKLKLLG